MNNPIPSFLPLLLSSPSLSYLNANTLLFFAKYRCRVLLYTNCVRFSSYHKLWSRYKGNSRESSPLLSVFVVWACPSKPRTALEPTMAMNAHENCTVNHTTSNILSQTLTIKPSKLLNVLLMIHNASSRSLLTPNADVFQRLFRWRKLFFLHLTYRVLFGFCERCCVDLLDFCNWAFGCPMLGFIRFLWC